MIYNKLNLEVAKIASDSEMRPELASVMFTKDKTVATDSFRLIEISVDKEQAPESFAKLCEKRGGSSMLGMKPFLAPAKLLKDIKIPSGKNFPLEGYVGIKHLDEQGVEFITAGESGVELKRMKRVEGTFPAYEAIFPTGEPKIEIRLNGDYLAELLTILAKIDQNRGVVMKIYGELKPIVLEADNGKQKGRAMLMPVMKN